MNITLVAGARPNFIKIAPIIEAIESKKASGVDLHYRLVHTGQHYDKNLSSAFFEELNIPDPDVNLEVKSGTQAEQTAAIMIGFEKELSDFTPDLVLVVGDVTSTMACAIVAKKACVALAHVEAGIRSGDLRMPEEINRMVTDSISDYFFTTSVKATEQLIKTGISPSRIHFVGNVMIDTLRKHIGHIEAPEVYKSLGLQSNSYFVLTLHRPSNVDGMEVFKKLLHQISELSRGRPVIFPVHPRTKKLLSSFDETFPNIHFIEAQGYLSFIFLIRNAFAVLTDSGGITEEATVLHVPCITFRDSTERPETCTVGTNRLVGNDPVHIKAAFDTLFEGQWPEGGIPELWDGHAAERIVTHLIDIFIDD
jgi:UDP-N-acetylglucosamine 2-epimerase (non-hydrolysing)